MMIITVLLSLLVGLSYTAYRIWQILPLGLWLKVGVLVLWILPLVLLFVAMGRWMSSAEPSPIVTQWDRLVYTVGTAWIIVLLYAVMLFLVLDVARLVYAPLSSYLTGSVYGSVGVLLVLLSVMLYGNARYHDKVRREIEIPLNKELERPLKIIAISDLHLGYTIGRGELSGWVDMLNREQADLIVIAGDLVDGDTRPIIQDKLWEELTRLEAPLGVYAALGNHEYIGGEASRQDFLSRTNIRLLRDRATLVAGQVYIVGRDDRTNPHRKPLVELVRDLDKTRPIIVLDHQPYHLEEAEGAGVDLQVSGHTHRGQVFPINLIVDRLYELSHGYKRRGDTHYYVSSGLGIWGGKFRIGTESEYAVITLEGQ